MDPLEDRLRRALGDERWRLPTDPAAVAPEAMHRIRVGATRRRRRRAAAGVVTSLAVLAGGAGLAVELIPPSGPSQQVALPDESDPRPERPPKASEPTDAGPRKAEASPPEPPPETATHSPEPTDSPDPEVNSKSSTSPVPPEFRAVSVAAADSQTLWVLGDAKRPGSTAIVARTDDGGETFDVVGELDTEANTGVDPQTSGGVSQIRFADDKNGWVFGYGLWSTHDGGGTWSSVDNLGVPVERLEVSAGRAYALARGGDRPGLWVSPAEQDAWEAAPVELADPVDLAVSGDLVVIADRATDGEETAQFRVSADGGRTFADRTTPCPGAGMLTANGESLWLACQVEGSAQLYVSDDRAETWRPVGEERSMSADAEVGAKSDGRAVAADPDGMVLVEPDGTTHTVDRPDMAAPTSVGFTDPDTGYLLDREGRLFRTTDGGKTWNQLDLG